MSFAETPRFQLRLPLELRDELQKYADAEHRSLAGLIVHILRDWVARRRQQDTPG